LSGQAGHNAQLNVLGTLELTGAPGRPLHRIIVQPKRLAMLVYLVAALPGACHRRDTITAMFWPAMDHPRASRALRQALYFLRSCLPAGSVTNRGNAEVRIEQDSITCDSVTFSAALDGGREEQALACYRGDLLPGFHVWGAPDFNRWLEMERERLRRRACRAATFLSRRCQEQGDLGRAASWARRAADHAPLDEATQSDAAILLARAGHRHEAIQTLDNAFNSLRRAGLDSSGRLESLALQIRSGLTDELRLEPYAAPGEQMRVVPVRAVGRGQVARASPADGSAIASGNLEAYHSYLRGRHASRQRTPGSMLKAVEHYHLALRLDPGLAVAHVGLADVWTVLPVYSAYPPAEAYPRAREHAAKAIALDETLAEAHASLALSTVCFEWDWSKAESQFERALELDRGSPLVWVPYALYLLTPTGRFEEAIRAIEVARQLSPSSPAENAYVAMVCYHARRYERATLEARLALELDERFPLAWWVLGMAQEQGGLHAEAVRSFEQAVGLTHGSPLMLAQLGRACARAGRRREAEEILLVLHEPDQDGGPTPYFTASIHAALGDVSAAMQSLERAYAQRVPHLVFLGVAPELDSLRQEKRFRELLLRMGLAPAHSIRDEVDADASHQLAF
jgi:tetratricopeptide (TPR) repeat protein